MTCRTRHSCALLFTMFSSLAAMSGVANAGSPAASKLIECVFAVHDRDTGKVVVQRLDALSEGTSRGIIKCTSDQRLADIWTLDIGTSPTAGVRVGPLFRTSILGKLDRMSQMTLNGSARLTIFERASTAADSRAGITSRRHRYQQFMTLCDLASAADPLNCSYGNWRVKGRVTMVDRDRNGELDTTLHELSLFDGGRRLHVIAFNTGIAAYPEDHIPAWLEAFRATSKLLDR